MRLASNCTHDSIVDGTGLRMVVWAQGCKHNCPGCHNPETHSFNGGIEVYTEEILAEFDSNPLLTGITLSGGDPFEQAEACAILAREVVKRGKDVWTYTGYTIEEILKLKKNGWLELLYYTDVLVDGPYIEQEKNLQLDFRGSANQRLVDVKREVLPNLLRENLKLA
ncbi:anaerobic ribonucleoside-triphosphate reductase activating protein [Desulfitispora alkaliphila]|uniref:anaerobic ribonucleoside-triphosphate reductase activating protein n=1 Tax=Desulfitispora alkaliphila TaxID=622674 RepID=UPI003D192401